MLTFNGGPHDRIVPVLSTFDGLVYFNFLQDDFVPPSASLHLGATVTTWGHCRGLKASTFRTPRVDSYGAFCLWECDSSPLIEHLVTRWNRGRPVESRRSILRHFETSCDELGSFELVAGDVTIEQLDS